MFGLGVPELIVLICIFAPVVLWIIALVDIIKSEYTANNKIIWLLMVLLLPILGAILYLLIGKKQKVPYSNVNTNGTGKKFCSDCGEELSIRAELCPKCGVRQLMAKKTGTNSIAIVLIIVFVGLGSVAVLGILGAIAIPQFSAYRMKAYNSAAMSDLKTVKTSIEAYATGHSNSYPESLAPVTVTISPGVSVQYEKRNNSSYAITSIHKDGDRIYLATSDAPEIMWRSKSDDNGHFLPL